MLTRRSWWLSLLCALVGVRRLAAYHIPMVDDLRWMPKGVFCLYRHQPFADWGCNTDYYIAAKDGKVLCRMVPYASPPYGGGEAVPMPWLNCPYPDIERKVIRDFLNDPDQGRYVWLKAHDPRLWEAA